MVLTSEGSGEPAQKGPTKHQTSSPNGWLPMRFWRMNVRRTKSTIISWDGSFIFIKEQQRLPLLLQQQPHPQQPRPLRPHLPHRNWVPYLLYSARQSTIGQEILTWISKTFIYLLTIILPCLLPLEPRHEKTCLRGFRPGKTPTGCTATETN